MSGKPFTLLVDIPLKPGRADEFMALFNEVFEAMKVEETFISAPRCVAPKTLIPSCSVKTGLTERISCRCNSNARIDIGTRLDCQSFSAPPANCPSSSRSAPVP